MGKNTIKNQRRRAKAKLKALGILPPQQMVMPGAVRTNVPKGVPVQRSRSMLTAKATGTVQRGNMVARANVLKSSKSASSLVLKQLALPHDYVGLRWKDEFTSEPTAVFSPYDFIAAPFTQVNTDVGNICNGGLSFCVVFRNPLRSLIYYDPNPTNKGTNYVCYFNPVTGPGALVNTWPLTDKTQQVIDPVYLQVGAGQTYQPHGTTLYTGSQNGYTGWWVDASTTHASNVVFTASNSSASYAINVLRLIGGEWVVQDGLLATSSSGVATVQITQSAYYSFQYDSLGNDNSSYHFTTIVYYIGTTSSTLGANVCCHLPCSAIVGNETLFPLMRVNAFSILVVNEAAELYKGGMVAGAQIPGGTDWTTLASGNTITNLASQNSTNVKQKDLATGLYGFARPTDADDFAYRNIFKLSQQSTGTAFLTGTDYSLIPKNDYLFVAMSAQASSSTYPGADVYLLASWAVEFRTNNQLFAQMKAPGLPQDYTSALTSLADMEQWHENPLHLSDILSFVKKAASRTVDAVVEYGPKVLSVAEMLAPLLMAL